MAVSAILVFLNGVFVGYEFAILKASPYNLETMAATGHRGAVLALRHKERVNEFLAVCQLGITAVTLALTVAFEPAVERLVGPLLHAFLSAHAAHGVNLGIALFVATSIHVTFGELIPKSLALIAPESLVARASGLINLLYRVARPPIWLFNGISTSLARLVTGRSVADAVLEEIDVREALRRSHRTGKIDDAQLELLDAVLSYPERMAREVMTPRSDVVAIDPSMSADEVLRRVTEHLYTRYPVVSNGNVEGYVLIHDLFALPDFKRIEWKRVIRPLPKVPETLTLPRVQRLMAGAPMAAVFDEYNEFVGIITHSDLDTQIMGELFDEDDEEALPLIQTDADGSYIINATEAVDDVLEALGLQVDDQELEGIDSFGGLLLTQLGREPVPGDEITWSGFRFTVEETDGFRITRARAVPLAPADGEGAGRAGEGEDG